jgi:hypothetical protein
LWESKSEESTILRMRVGEVDVMEAAQEDWSGEEDFINK